MTNARRSRTRGPLRAWAGDSLWRQFLVWLLRGVVSVVMLAIVFVIIWFVLTPNMISGIVNTFTNK